MSKQKIYAGIALLSMALISLQIVFMHLLAIIQWHHFAYMIISAALLGFGASGAVFAVFEKFFKSRAEELLPFLSLLCAVSAAFCAWMTSSAQFAFDSYLIFMDWANALKIFLNYMVFFLPFFFGAFVIALLFVKYISNINKLYFWNLLGSGIGGLFALLIIDKLPPERLIAAISFLPLIASSFFKTKKRGRAYAGFFCLVAISSLRLLIWPVGLNPSQYKPLSYALNLKAPKIIYEQNSVYGLLQALASPSLRYAKGVSLTYTKELPSVDMLYVNGETFGPLFKKPEEVKFLDYTPYALPYEISEIKKVLLFGAGSLYHAFYALGRDALEVKVVEQNIAALEYMKQRYSIDPKITLKSIEPRTFLALEKDDKYDLIILPVTGSVAGGAGLLSLREEYVLTKEFLGNSWQILNESGLIVISGWIDYPPRVPLKLAATLAEVLEEKNVLALSHVTALRDWGMIHFFLKKTPFSEAEKLYLRRFCREMSFDPLILNGIKSSPETEFHYIDDPEFFIQLKSIFRAQARQELYRNYDFNIKPATDNRPYFFKFLRPLRAQNIIQSFGLNALPFVELGYLIIILTFLQVFAACLILILLPLFKLKRKMKNKPYTLVYFGCLGAGFMFFEMALIQQFIFYLGNVIYAASIVISSVLIAAGFGSYASCGLSPRSKNLLKICAALALLIAAYPAVINYIFAATLHLNLALKIFICFGLIFVPAFIMGMPFPLGLRLTAEKSPTNLPWCWGINGCLSVIATVLAVIISAEAGFSALFLSAGALYAMAALINIKRR